jgi:hypothetical protein
MCAVVCYVTVYCGAWIPVFWRNMLTAFSPTWEPQMPIYNIFVILDPKFTSWNNFRNFTEWRGSGIAVEGYLHVTLHCFQICYDLDGYLVIISHGHSLAGSSSAYSCPDDLAIAEEATCYGNSQSDLWYGHVCGVCVTNNNGFWIGWYDLLALIYNHNQLWHLTINDCLRLAHSLLDCECLLFFCDWIEWWLSYEWLLELSDESVHEWILFHSLRWTDER